jgi:hypothetical protein
MINYNTARRIAGIGGGTSLLAGSVAGYSSSKDNKIKNTSIGASSGALVGIAGATGYYGVQKKRAEWERFDKSNKRMANKIFKPAGGYTVNINTKKKPETYALKDFLGRETPEKFEGLGHFNGIPVWLDKTPYLGQHNLPMPHAMAALEKDKPLKQGIYVSPLFTNMSGRHQSAVLAHEVQHIKGNHFERFFGKDPITGAPTRSLHQIWKSETDADTGATKVGLAPELREVVKASLGTKFETPWYNRAILTGRVAKLTKAIRV